MKKINRLLLVGFVVASQAACGRPSDAVPEIEAVLNTMDTMIKAYIGKDMATLEKVFHNDLVYGHTSGMTQDKATVLKVAMERDTQLLDLNERVVNVSGPVAMVRGITNLTLVGQEAGNGRGVLWILVRDENGPHGWKLIGRQNWPRVNPDGTFMAP